MAIAVIVMVLGHQTDVSTRQQRKDVRLNAAGERLQQQDNDL